MRRGKRKTKTRKNEDEKGVKEEEEKGERDVGVVEERVKKL